MVKTKVGKNLLKSIGETFLTYKVYKYLIKVQYKLATAAWKIRKSTKKIQERKFYYNDSNCLPNFEATECLLQKKKIVEFK